MLPVCSTNPCCSSHSQMLIHGGLQPLSPFHKDFESRYVGEDKIGLRFPNGAHVQRISIRAQAANPYPNLAECSEPSASHSFFDHPSYPQRSLDVEHKLYQDWSPFGQVNIGREKLKYVESYSTSAAEEGIADYNGQPIDNPDSLMAPVKEPQIPPPPIEIVPDDPSFGSDSLELNSNPFSTLTSKIDDFSAGVKDSLSTSLNTITSSITSVTKGAREGLDNALSRLFSAVDQTEEMAGNRLTSFTGDLKEAAGKATASSVDVLRGTIVAAEDLISKGVSSIVYSYGSAKELLPPEIKDGLNLSEEKAAIILRPVGTAFQQVYGAVEELERSLGLNPNDPLVSFVLFLGTSATLWVFYWVWTYGGYSGDLSPESTIELLTGKESAVLIDVRPEILRERDGIPDLRRAARFRYSSVTLPEVDGPVRKLLKSGVDLDDTLIAAVIRNLKVVQDRSKVIVIDADGTRSKGIARSLRKLGVKQPYLVQGGFQSWRNKGLRVKELKPETTLTILNEEAEAIFEEISLSPVQVLGYGVGLVAALYALIEWEKMLQLIGIFGVGLTIFLRVASYENAEDFKQDVRLLLAPARLGAQAFSWAAGKLENNRIGLPTSPSSSDVQNRVLQAAAKHESQPAETEGNQNPALESVTSIKENVDLSEA